MNMIVTVICRQWGRACEWTPPSSSPSPTPTPSPPPPTPPPPTPPPTPPPSPPGVNCNCRTYTSSGLYCETSDRYGNQQLHSRDDCHNIMDPDVCNTYAARDEELLCEWTE